MMIGKLLPILLALIGLGAGVGGGIALRPEPEDVAMVNPCGEGDHADKPAAYIEEHSDGSDQSTHDFVKLNNQFVVPILEEGRVGALVVMSLSLEITEGQSESIYRIEPKIRDAFLRVLFDHANAGGFNGTFTKSTRMNALRKALREAAKSLLGNSVFDVLIADVVRQDA